MSTKKTIKPMVRRPALRIVSSDLRELGLAPQVARLLHEVIDAYDARRRGTLRHTEATVRRDLSIVHDFVRFTRKPPWDWDEVDFDRWCHEIGIIRRLAPATQRHYQSIIRAFLRYIIDNVRFHNEVRRLFGKSVIQICHDDNCIPHVLEREMVKARRAMTHDEIEIFFKAVDRAINEARRFFAKDFWPLMRDKTFFFTLYAGGLRISEGIGLDVESFFENAEIPKFGRFGFISAMGKGSRGSGKKHRNVPIDHPDLPDLLRWYENEVRPHFMRRADPNERAFFLSERGNRPSITTMEARFQHLLEKAGLEGRNLTPHSLRHSSVTHGGMLYSGEAMRRKHGHANQSTTQIYMHVPDEFVRDEMTKVTRRMLKDRKKDEDDKNGK